MTELSALRGGYNRDILLVWRGIRCVRCVEIGVEWSRIAISFVIWTGHSA